MPTAPRDRPLLGRVEVSVPLADVVLQCEGLDQWMPLLNVAWYPLPGGLEGRVCVNLRLTVNANKQYRMLEVVVEALAEGTDVLCRGQLSWVTVDCANHHAHHVIWGPPSSVWLHGNGCLASMMFTHGYAMAGSGTVTVYGPARKPVPDYSALRGLAAFSDVTLRAAGADFPVHRAVLAARSPVFHAMLAGGFKEAVDKVVDLAVDCSADAFGVFLDFVYSGELAEGVSCAELIALLGLAECYQVAELKAECCRRLLAVGAEEALLVVEAALEQPFLPEDVSRRAGRVIRENWSAVLASAAWARFAEAKPDVAMSMKIMADEAPTK